MKYTLTAMPSVMSQRKFSRQSRDHRSDAARLRRRGVDHKDDGEAQDGGSGGALFSPTRKPKKHHGAPGIDGVTFAAIPQGGVIQREEGHVEIEPDVESTSEGIRALRQALERGQGLARGRDFC